MDPEVERNIELESAAFADLDDVDSWRVFADWLQGQGDPRGEIASLAVHHSEGFLSERRAIAARLSELERPFIDAWHLWAQDHDLVDVQAQFKRGFVFSLIGALTQLRPMLDELFERDPIQRLTLTGVDPDSLVRLLEAQPGWLRRLRYLKLEGELGEAGAAALASVELPGLRGLNLLSNEIDADACVHLARLDTRELSRLTLTSNEIDGAGLSALLRSPTRGQWRELYLSGNPIPAEGPARIAADSGLASLTGLYMRQTDTSLADFARFADPTVLPALVRLEIPGYGSWQAQNRPIQEALQQRFGPRLRLD